MAEEVAELERQSSQPLKKILAQVWTTLTEDEIAKAEQEVRPVEVGWVR